MPPVLRESLPRFVEPMLLTTAPSVPASDGWALEVKWDGMRAQARIEQGQLGVRSRRDRDWTAQFPELHDLPSAARGRSLLLDAELVCFDAAGLPDFARLRARLTRGRSQIDPAARRAPAKLVVFDVLHLDGANTRRLPYRARRELLAELELEGPCWMTPPSYRADDDDLATSPAPMALKASSASAPPPPTSKVAGAVGMAIVEALARRGESVRVVNRSGLREPLAGAQSLAGDVTDPAFAASATRGARVVYEALNPPYHRWAQEFPGLQAAAIAASQNAGARLVVMDNVYMYGRPHGRPLTEDRAYDAHTRKGRVRAAMARDLMAAHDAGRVQVTVGRASDFFGPRAGAQSLIGDWVIPPALAGKPASIMGDPDMPHTYTFIPDIGENLVALGDHDDALGRVWHRPSPETRTTRDVVALVFQAAGTTPRLKVTPAWQMRALGLVNRTVREINEMRYEFDEPFVVDASRAQTELGLRATPLADAVEQTVRWYRAHATASSAAESGTGQVVAGWE